MSRTWWTDSTKRAKNSRRPALFKPTVFSLEDRLVPTVFSNSSLISIPAGAQGTLGTSDPYPAPITVSGLAGVVTNVSVTLPNLTHDRADDLDIVLEGPGGQSVVLMSDNGGSDPLAGVTLTFSDKGATVIGTTSPASGTYLPSNEVQGTADSWPGLVGVPAAALSTFLNTTPNGDWKLRIVDDATGNVGSLPNGWSIDVTSRSNTAPVAAPDAYTVNEDQLLTVGAPGLLSNDTDADGDPRTAVLVAPPANGTLVLAADGSFTYQPDSKFSGKDSFTYKAFDTIATGNTTTVTITVNDTINYAPQAIDDAYMVQAGLSITVPASKGIIANDLDYDGTDRHLVLLSENFESFPLTAYTSPSTIGDGDGTDWTGALPTGWSRDQGNSPVGPNGPTPIEFYGWNIHDIDSWNATQGNQQRALFTKGGIGAHGNVLVADGDAYDDEVHTTSGAYTFFLKTAPVSLNGVLPGTLKLDFDSSFRPENPQVGIVEVSYDGGTTFNEILHLDENNSGGNGAIDRVNEHLSLVANNPANATTAVFRYGYGAGNSWWWAIDNISVSAEKTNPTNAHLSSSVTNSPMHGALNTNADGSFKYTPNAGYTGTDTFTYKLSDTLTTSNTATVTFTVVANATPPVANGDTYTTNQNTTVTIAVPGVLANDSEPDSGDISGLTATLVAGPTNGALTFNADGSFKYVPVAAFFGTDSFTYKANDGTPGNTATVSINVLQTNKTAPVAVNDSYTTAEDTTLSITATGVLGNDSDADGNPITATLVTGPTHGSLTLATNGSFVYTPNADYNGPDTFTYKASDFLFASNTATVNITVTAVNDAPVAVIDSFTTTAGTPLTVPPGGVLANDHDDGTYVTLYQQNFEGLTLSAYVQPSAPVLLGKGDGTDWTNTFPAGWTRDNGTTPNGNPQEFFGWTGVDIDSWIAAVGGQRNQFTRGGTGAHGTVLVVDPQEYDIGKDVDNVNAAPGKFQSFLTLAPISLGTAGQNTVTFEYDSSFSPFAYSTGFVEVSYDAGATFSRIDTLSSSLLGGTRAKVNTNINEHRTVAANNPAGAMSAIFRIGFQDAGSDRFWAIDNITVAGQTPLSGSAFNASTVASPTKGTLSLSPNGGFTYTPIAGKSGVDFFTYKVNDGVQDSNTAKVKINIDNVAPVAVNDTYTVAEDGVLTVPVGSGLLFNDTDSNGDTLTASKQNKPRFGSVTVNGDGSFVYTPVANFFGADSFTYTITDGDLAGTVGTVTINVSPVNTDAPITVNDSFTTAEDTPLVVAAQGVLTNDSDPDNSLQLFFEDFEGIALKPNISRSESGGDGTDWTNELPPGMTQVINGPIGNPIEFQGWNIHDIDSWVATQGNQQRSQFVRGGVGAHGSVLVADGDAYDDLGLNLNAQNTNPIISTPEIPLSGVATGSLVLEFDSSFRPEDASQFGSVNVSYDGGAPIDLLDLTVGNSGGVGSLQRVNDHYVLNASNPDGATSAVFSFNYTAGNDWWWALDNLNVRGTKSASPQTLTAAVAAQPAHGTVALAGDGSFTYTPAANYNGPDSFTYTVGDGTNTSNSATVALTVTSVIDPAPTLSSVVVNNGAAQRSRVTTIAVNFDSIVTLAPDAFTLTRPAYPTTSPSAATLRSGTPGAGEGKINVTTSIVAGHTVATLTFATNSGATNAIGEGAEFGSLSDGSYVLTVSAAGVVGPDAPMAADYVTDSTPGSLYSATGRIYRLFGDNDGDADNDSINAAQFRQSFGSIQGNATPPYNPNFDFDNDGDVDSVDAARFRLRFSHLV